MSGPEDTSRKTVPNPRANSPHSFHNAFGFGAVWWVVVSSIAVAHNRTRPPGIIFGELLGTSLLAAIVAGIAGRLVRTRRPWLLIVAVFLFVWFAARFAIVVNHMITG
jgi:hypothetical protein